MDGETTTCGPATSSSTAAAASTVSPYNNRNVLLTEEALLRVLRTYGHVYPVHNINTFRKALTHRSYCTRKNENFIEGNAECPTDCLPLQEESSERLEFLGDAVLNLVVADYLFQRYPDENEGFLTKMRSKLVNGEMLKELCLLTGLNAYVLISKQIEESGGRRAKNVLEDCFEAFVGAMFIDAGRDERGYAIAFQWITNFIEANIDFADLVAQYNSYKDMLTKYFQHAYNSFPCYDVDETYETDDKRDNGEAQSYTVCIRTREGLIVGTGSGSSKKTAENEAARKALVYFGQLDA